MFIKRKNNIVFLLIIFLAAINAWPQFVLAKNKPLTSFGVSPAKIEFDSANNRPQQREVFVDNLGVRPVKVRIYFTDVIFSSKPGTTYIYAKPRELPVSAVPYLSLDRPKIMIPAKSRKSIKVLFNASGGEIKTGRYSVIMFEVEQSVKQQNKTKIKLAGRIASTVFLVPGKGFIKRSGHINFFKARSSIGLNMPFLSLEQSPKFVVSFKNTGNTHLNANGVIEIEDIFGRLLQKIVLSEYEIYTKTTRMVEIPWKNPAFGYFRAKAKINSSLYDYNKKEVSPNDGFLVLPWWILLIFLITLGYIGLRIIRYVRRRKQAG